VLIGKRLDQDLAAKLQRPVRLANDANCFARSEAVDGGGRLRCVWGLLGTGVGGGVVVERKILTGRNDIAGEWGRINVLDPDDVTVLGGGLSNIAPLWRAPGPHGDLRVLGCHRNADRARPAWGLQRWRRR
jgi:predicted NBD/HSP70 family sugar kinase